MAGRGPAPKDPDQRRRANAPAAGEWITLPAKTHFRVPKLPTRGKGFGPWSARTRAAWKAWWTDPAATQWGEGDRDLVVHLAYLYEQWVREPTVSAAGEIRQLRDSLGLSPKGRQDRRWRYAPQAEVADLDTEREKRPRSRARLKVADPAAANG